MVGLDRCKSRIEYYTLDDPPGRICVANKTGLVVFKMVAGINELKTAKLNSCNCKCKFDGRKCSLNQK